MSHTKIIQTGKYLEVYTYEKSVSSKIKSGRRKSFKQRDQRPLYSRPDSIRRRYKSFSRLVRSNLVGEVEPSLLTLTCFEVVGIERGYDYLRQFWRKLQQSFIKVERYIAVPEFQKRGAVHFHLIVWGLNDYVDKERSDRQIQNLWQRGFVDCLRTDGNEKLVGYLAKYMRKSMSDRRLVGQKAYTASRSCLRPLSFSSGAPFNYSMELYGVDLSTVQPLLQKDFHTQWLGMGRYRLYKI
jgi:hypothetical protein